MPQTRPAYVLAALIALALGGCDLAMNGNHAFTLSEASSLMMGCSVAWMVADLIETYWPSTKTVAK